MGCGNLGSLMRLLGRKGRSSKTKKDPLVDLPRFHKKSSIQQARKIVEVLMGGACSVPKTHSLESRRAGKLDNTFPDWRRRYKLVSQVSKGVSGTVWKAVDLQENRIVAIKCIPRGKEITRHVESEVLLHRRLSHKNVIGFKEVVLSDKDFCIVLEYAPGGDLVDVLNDNGCLREDEARKFFRQLISAVQYCHKQDVANRDIKLENMLLDKDRETLKLADFGYGKDSRQDAMTMLGTATNLAPEILTHPMKKKAYDPKIVDIWTCGICLFRMIYGTTPFEKPPKIQESETEDSHKSMLQRIINAKVKIPTTQMVRKNKKRREKMPIEVSESCRNLLAGILQRSPKKRLTLSQIQSHEWFRKGYENVGDQLENDDARGEWTCAQSEDQILAVLHEARLSGGFAIESRELSIISEVSSRAESERSQKIGRGVCTMKSMELQWTGTAASD